ncbi:unnamed protein product [Hermetia illucens]|uniref:Uncharacterized protein n=1 Tax=Hermetia illucens TaxID=343691 RepID=A0A7R8UG93_HERIL|nr:zinc finger protein OZF-like [Hermetia illucens]CAD7080315.1 unnamed protein product [Hermetia illucens]
MFCRICLVEHASGLAIFEEYRGEFLPGIVRTIAGVEIIQGDGLPEHICYDCAHILLQAQDIRKRCLESDAVLHARVLMEQHSQDSLQKIESEKNIFIWETIIQTYEPPPEDIFKAEPVEPPPSWEEPKEEEVSDESEKETTELENGCPENEVEEVFKCKHCPKQFSNKTRFNRHEHYHKQTKCKCPICNNVFSHKSNLKRHIATHKNQNQFNCDKCKAKFSDSNDLYEHLLKHSKTEAQREYIHECNFCDKRTKSVAAYRLHMKTEHGMEAEKPFLCKICPLTFASKQGLNRHIDNIHDSNRKNLRNRDKSFSCPTCGKKFSANFHLQVHIRIHTEEHPYKCDQCPKSFAQASGLKLHMFAHNGEKPFACRVCGKRFKQYGYVRAHLRSHSGEKGHACKVCNRSFRVKGNLTAHMATHIGSKPFACDVCGKSYAHSKKLRTHFEKVHRSQPKET